MLSPYVQHLFPLITASIHMIIQVATNLIWLRRRREVFKNVENSVFYIVQKEMEEEKQVRLPFSLAHDYLAHKCTLLYEQYIYVHIYT